QWEDEEPYNIAELIEEYESSLNKATPWTINFESEETEVKKDKQWLRNRYEQMETVKMTTKNSRGSKSVSYIKKKTAINLLNQLDEPEVLSQEWISENVEYAYFDMLDGSGRLSSATAIIKPEKLQNLLVPKQEEKDPETVASVIADFYKSLERLTKVLNVEVEELEQC